MPSGGGLQALRSTLADLTRAKKVLRHLKGTRELNSLLDETCIETE